MRMILGLLMAVMLTLGVVETSYAASNENNPHVLCVDLGSLSADGVVKMGAIVGKSAVVQSVQLWNGAAIAASDTNYVQLELKKGSTVVAELDSRAAHENGVAQDVLEALNVVSAAKTIASGELITVNYNETDAGTNVALTAALLCMQYVVK